MHGEMVFRAPLSLLLLSVDGTHALAAVEWARMHGRGVHHLSAACAEGDVLAYQTGTWEVDGEEPYEHTRHPLAN